jgi:hypothetical protein
MTLSEEEKRAESIASTDASMVVTGSVSEIREPSAPGSSSQTSSRKGARRASLRSGIRAEASYLEDVENKGSQVRAKDIIKIFSSDEDIIEVSLEQVDRVKQSK